jgi:hypothetical protein
MTPVHHAARRPGHPTKSRYDDLRRMREAKFAAKAAEPVRQSNNPPVKHPEKSNSHRKAYLKTICASTCANAEPPSKPPS